MVTLLAESWTWFSIATLILLVRCVARLHYVGTWRKLQLDDWLMVAALCFYTVETFGMNIAASPNTNLLPPGWLDNHTLTPEDHARRVYVAKWVVVVEQCQCVTIWLLKACLLIMYARFTAATYPVTNILVKILLTYVGLTFIIMEALYFGYWCRPFSDYWAVPAPNPQCSAATNHLILNAAFNLSSDVATLCITLPLFARTSLPFERKASLCIVFGLGIFTIVSAVLNKYYSFVNPYGLEWTNWYLREVSTAILVANLPFTWGILRRVCHFKHTGSRSGSNPLQMLPAHRPRRRWYTFGLKHASMTGTDTSRNTAQTAQSRKTHSGPRAVGSDASEGIHQLSVADIEAGQAEFRHMDMRHVSMPAPREAVLFDSREDRKYLGRSVEDGSGTG